MGEVVCVIKILPKDVEQYEQMKEDVRNACSKLEGEQEEDIAFGLKSFNITVVVDDSAGGTEELEKKLSALPTVGDVTVTDMARLL